MGEHRTPLRGSGRGPTVVKLDGTYYMFYSCNDYQLPTYAVGVATAKSPTGPWTKPAAPIISRDNIGQNGTGHGDLFRDKDGHWQYVFHTHNNSTTVQTRKTAIVQLEYTGTGFKVADGTFRYDAQVTDCYPYIKRSLVCVANKPCSHSKKPCLQTKQALFVEQRKQANCKNTSLMRIKHLLSDHYKSVISTLFFVAMLLLWGFWLPEVTAYHEQTQMFLFTPDYFTEHLPLPGALADYASEFLVQFSFFVLWGAAVTALLLTLMQRVVWAVMRQCGRAAHGTP